MKVNKKVIDLLKECNIEPNNGITYLLSLYFNFNPDYIPDLLKQKVNISKIVEYSSTGLKWNISLFEGVETAFEWVETEYIPLFAKVGKDKYKREATSRIKKLFRDNPDIRKDEILGATYLYLNNTSPMFVRFPHYFIEKGAGLDKTQDILEWVDKYRLKLENESSRVEDNTRRLL